MSNNKLSIELKGDLFKSIFNKIDTAVFLHDLQGKIISVNSKAYSSLGYKKSEIVGQKIQKFFTQSDRKIISNQFKSFSKRKNLVFEGKIVKKNGKEIAIKIKSTIINYGNLNIAVSMVEKIPSLTTTIEELRSSEEKYRKLIHTAYDAVFVVEFKTGIIINTNLAASKMVGIPVNKITGMKLAEILPENEAKRYKKIIQDNIKSGKWIKDRLNIFHKDGHIIPVEITTNLIQVGNKKLIQVNFHDITIRKKIEEKLKNAANDAQRFLDVAGVIIVVLGIDQKVRLINKRGCQILGYSENEILGKNWFNNFLPQRYRKETKAVFKNLNVGKTEKTEYFENPILTKNNQEKTIAWHNIILKDKMGNFIGTLSSGEDITEKRIIEKSLMESEEKYRLMFNKANDAVMVHGLDENGLPGKFVEVNDIACKKLGYSRQELLKMIPEDIEDPEYELDIKQIMKKIKAKKHHIFEQVHITKNGHRIPVEINAHLFVFRGKMAILSVIRDITERKKTEDDLNHYAQRLQILRDIDHKIISSVDPDEISGIILQQLKRLFIFDRGSVIIFDFNTKYAKLLSVYFKGKTNFTKNKFIPIKDYVIDNKLFNGQINLVNDLSSQKKVSKVLNVLKKEGIRSYINVPLMFKKELIGSLNIGSFNKNYFDDEKISIVQEVAQLLAIAIQQSRQQEALALSESRYRNLFQKVPVGLYRTNQKGEIIDANLALVEMLKYPDINALKSINVNELYVSRKDRNEWQKRIESEKTVRDFEVRLRRYDSKIIWVQNNSVAYTDEDGKVNYYDGSIEDITQRKSTLDALKHSEERYRLLFEEAACGIVLIEENITISMVNKKLLNMSQFSLDEVVNKKFLKFIPNYQKKPMLEMHKKRLKGEDVPRDYEGAILSKKGQEIPVFISVSYFPNTHQSLVYLIDLSDIKKLEQKLIETANKYQTLFEYNVNPLIVEKEDRTIGLINKAFEKISGYKRNELENKLKTDIFVEPKELQRIKKVHNLRRSDPEKTPEYYETIFVDRFGERRNVIVRENIIPDQNERIISLVDITSQKQLNLEIQKRNRELSFYNRILSSVSQMINLEEINEFMLEALSEFTLFEEGFMVLSKDDSGYAFIGSGESTKEKKKTYKIINELLIEHCLVVESGIRRLINCPIDAQNAIKDLKYKDLLIIPLYLPPLYKEEGGVGYIILLSHHKRIINPDELDLIQVLGVQLGVIIENINLFERTKIRAEQLRILNHLSLDVIALHDLKKTLRLIADNARYLTNSRYCVIRGHQEAPGYIPQIYSGFSKNICQVKGNVRKNSLAIKFLLMGESIRLDDISKHPDSKGLPDGHLKLRGLLGIPVLDSKGNAICGILLSDKLGGTDYSLLDQEIIEGLAAIAAIAIESAILFEEMKSKTKALEDAYRELRESDFLKSEFVSIASHELRSPLTTIKGYVEIIKDGILGEVDPAIQDKLKVINREIGQLTQLADDLLDLSRIESKKYPLKIRRFLLSRLIQEIVDDFKIAAEKKSVYLKYDISKSIKYINADRNALNRILKNLVDNGIKNNIDNGSVIIKVRIESNKYHFNVKDTGIGIPKSDLEKIFTRFFVVESSLSRGRKGIGLGLSIVKGLVEAHGGEVWAESKIGSGSEFHFTIPMSGNKRRNNG